MPTHWKINRPQSTKTPTVKEAWISEEVESLLRSIAGCGQGRLIFKMRGLSVAKRMPLHFWPGTEPQKMRLPGCEVKVSGLTAVCHEEAQGKWVRLSLFDQEWKLAMMLEVSRSSMALHFKGSAHRLRIQDMKIAEGIAAGTALEWDELWPQANEKSDPGTSIQQASELVGRRIEIKAFGEHIQFDTTMLATIIDVDGSRIRVSDLPRTQVCYVNLQEILTEDLSSGTMRLLLNDRQTGWSRDFPLHKAS